MRHPPWLSRLIFFFFHRVEDSELVTPKRELTFWPLWVGQWESVPFASQHNLHSSVLSFPIGSFLPCSSEGGVVWFFFFFNCGEESRRFFLLHFFNVTFQYCYCRYCRPFEKILCHLTLSSWNWFQFVATEGGLPRFKMLLRGMSTRKK